MPYLRIDPQNLKFLTIKDKFVRRKPIISYPWCFFDFKNDNLIHFRVKQGKVSYHRRIHRYVFSLLCHARI